MEGIVHMLRHMPIIGLAVHYFEEFADVFTESKID